MALRANARVDALNSSGANSAYLTFPPTEAHGFRCIFGRKWFTRIWCLQECSLAPRQVCFIGRMTTSFQKLMMSHQPSYEKWLSDPKSTKYFANDSLAFVSTVLVATKSQVFTELSQDKQLSNSIFSLGGQLQTTDKRDRLYAIQVSSEMHMRQKLFVQIITKRNPKWPLIW